MSEILGVDAHPQLNQRGQGHQGEDGGEGDVETEVGVIALYSLILDHAVARAIEALAVPRAVAAARCHLAEKSVTIQSRFVSQQLSSDLNYVDHDSSSIRVILLLPRCRQRIHSFQRIFIVEPEK